ncbi:hypothetical protein ACFPVX_08895 [Cohnella faecalis]|uniref:Hydrolase n=1 Tax=Cohnella faecalis TaxID=2315694 RepID=A0A398CKT7_9BACL|nr:hypothetical protein [Cohnella faecalis]RIE01819.1 hypothetical protein D3H35_13575 [Cohnella faecalis]
MDRQRYYVSVQAKTITNHQGDAAYEFAIDALPEDIDKLQELFAAMEEFDEMSFIRNPLPGIPYHHDSENDGYDYYLKESYKLIGQLSDEKTRSFIASMPLNAET